MTRKRLAIFSPGGIGGGAFSQGLPAIEKVVAGLAERYDVTFYSLAPTNAGFNAEGYELRSPSGRVESIEIRGLRWLLMSGRFLIDHLARKYDVMLSFWGYPVGTVVVALSKLLRIPAVVMLLGAETADLPAIGYGHLGSGVSKRLVLWTCARASALLAVSRYQLNVLRAHGFEREDARVVPIGAEAELFTFETKARAAPLKIIHVANLTEVKDQETLIRGFALLRADLEAKLRIVGADHLGGAIHELVRRLGLEADVELTGPVPFASMPDQYHWADMFVLTSLSEGQNRSLTEAAMRGVLQVSTPVGHIEDLGDEAALVIEAGSPRDLADKIKQIAADQPRWERKIANARSWAAAHDMRWTLEQIGSIIEGLAAT